GTTLFLRRPFSLTPAGEELFSFIRPFFDNLASTSERIRGNMAQYIRIAANSIILRDHLPDIFVPLRAKFPCLKITLREGIEPEMEQWLQEQEIDFAITLIDRKPPAGVHAAVLIELPLALFVPKRNALKSPAELWQRDKISETLITLPAN